jgi:hypothetical protein
MTRRQADTAFDSLRRHAAAIPPPTAATDALELLDRAVLSPLQRDAMIHYIAVGPANVTLAYTVLKAGAAVFALAPFAAREAGVGAAAGGADETGPGAIAGGAAETGAGAAASELPAERECFATRTILLATALEAADPADRGARLLGTFTGQVAANRRHWSIDGLLEAAGAAYMIAQLLESPPAAATRQ